MSSKKTKTKDTKPDPAFLTFSLSRHRFGLMDAEVVISENENTNDQSLTTNISPFHTVADLYGMLRNGS